MKRTTYEEVQEAFNGLMKQLGWPHAKHLTPEQMQSGMSQAIGTYELGSDICGYRIQRIVNEGGAIRTIARLSSKREFLNAIEFARAILDELPAQTPKTAKSE